MEVPLALRSVVIMITLLSVASGTDTTADVAESAPRRVVLRKSFRYPDFNRMPVSGLLQDDPQFWDNQLLTTVDPNIDLLMRSTAHLINTIRRLEIKFDRVFDAVDFGENAADDVMNKLRQIHQYVQGTPTNAYQTDCPSSVEGMPQSNLMNELVQAVRYSNENIRKLVTNFDMVTESGRRSMQSLEKVSETVQDINERTIRIQQISFGQFPIGNPATEERNGNSLTPLNDPIHSFVTQTNTGGDSTSSGMRNDGKTSRPEKPIHESSGEKVHNWNRNSITNFNADWTKNTNAGRIDQYGTRTPTNYDSNGQGVNGSPSLVASTMPNYDSSHNQNSFTISTDEIKNVGHNRNNQQDRMKGFVDQNKVPVAAKPSGVNSNWNSYETFIGESNQNRNSLEPKQSGTASGNNPPVESSTKTVFQSNAGEVHNWNSNSQNSLNEGPKSGVAQANYESNVSGVFDRNYTRTISESSGNVLQNQNSFVYSNVAMKENENVGQNNRTTDSKDGAMKRNESPNVASTKTNYESDKIGVHSPSHNQNRNSHSSLTKEKEVMDQRNRIVTSASSTGASSTTSSQLNEQNVGSSVSIPRTTATTTKVQTSTHTVNSQRTYRNVRKDAKRVTFEPNKRNCHDLTVKRNGIYKFGSMDEVANDGDRFFYERYCDFYTDNRAWTVIQRRFASYSQESFNRTWLDYKHGFGKLDDEFWFGNDFIHQLTFDDDVELRILLEDESGKTNWVEYSLFKMKSETDNYKLVISGYSSGSVQESLLYHNDQDFSTYDHRNGNNQQTSCASSIGNGWWFKNCSDKGILGNFLGSTSTKMMIRPKK